MQDRYRVVRTLSAVCSQAIKTAAVYDKAENRLKTAGWYRIATLSGYGTYLLSISGSWHNVNSTAASFIINKSHDQTNIHQLSPASATNMITKVRLVNGELAGTIYIEVYNNYTNENIGQPFVYRITTLIGMDTTGSDVVIQDPTTVTHSLAIKQELTITTNASDLVPPHTHSYLPLSGGAMTGAIDLTNSPNPEDGYKMGLSLLGSNSGGIHFKKLSNSGNDWGNAITWGYSSNDITAVAGIYVKTSHSYGSKMYLATTDLYNDGPKAALEIDSAGNIKALRKNFIGNLTGNAASATKLATACNIYGQSFNGTVNITGDEKSIEFNNINAIDNDPNNYTTNYSLKLQSANNALMFMVDKTTNGRKAMIQVGHSSTNYAQYLGELHLNPLGGKVIIGIKGAPDPALVVTGNTVATTFIGNLIGNVTGNASSASMLTATSIKTNAKYRVSTSSWANTGYTFESLDAGTYAIQLTSDNLVASGIMSVLKNVVDTIGDEIPLHVYGTAGWRPYLRTIDNKLQIASNDVSNTERTVTIKIARIL